MSLPPPQPCYGTTARDKGPWCFLGDASCRTRAEMEESFEMFEEELGRPEPPPQKPVRQVRRPVPVSLRKAISPQNLSQIETPWEGVTLNRCLLITITILLLSSGFQKLHETIKGRRAVEEEEYADALTPETSLYEVLFWWLPDFNDEDDDRETKQVRLKKGVRERSLKGLRSSGTPERRLFKGREGEEKRAKRAKRERDEETKLKKKGKQVKLREEEK
ncbi:uncharacterized protein ACWYII_019762 [Salvelinus alpinus]